VTGDALVDMTGDEFVREVAKLNVPAKRSYHIHTNALVPRLSDFDRLEVKILTV